MVAESLPEENKDNVLFEPTRQVEETTVKLLSEANDVSTVDMSDQITYDSNVDPKLIRATKIRCCLCGVIMPPNTSNTCIQCLKSQIDITEGISKTVQL